jgi:hypothetical protein
MLLHTLFFFFGGDVVTPTAPLAVVTAGALVAVEAAVAVAVWREVEKMHKNVRKDTRLLKNSCIDYLLKDKV